jgi:predicted nucleic acid-binding protein
MIILVDTNVLLDVVQHRAGFYRDSSRVWTLAEQGQVKAFVSMISFNNVYYILRRQVGSATALDAVKQIRRIFRAVAFDESVLDRAVQLPLNDLEDAIQAASALRAQAEAVVTRNVSDFTGIGIVATTPDELLAILKP